MSYTRQFYNIHDMFKSFVMFFTSVSIYNDIINKIHTIITIFNQLAHYLLILNINLLKLYKPLCVLNVVNILDSRASSI